MRRLISGLLSLVAVGCVDVGPELEPTPLVETPAVSMTAQAAPPPSFQCAAGAPSGRPGQLAATVAPKRDPMYRVPSGSLRSEVYETAPAPRATVEAKQ
jgi:hypothetical protein